MVMENVLLRVVPRPNPQRTNQCTLKPEEPKNPNQFKKIYPTLALVAYTLSFLDPENDWRNRMGALIEAFPAIKGLGPETMVFPSNWAELAIWRADDHS
ncbi:Abi family protein [Corynebacterium diphtheriae]|nr:Abi family protein [Corynebacterium diphtheriae]CAB0616486.1 Abi family protein [Corynebacterium diphtheriae]CAB0758398.1 Abi family protein [Corynebacterium diphtheriae]